MSHAAHRGPAIAGVLLASIGSLAFRPAVDSDYFWHLANGRHLADGVLFGGIDRYSWTAAGQPWVAHEWLTEAVMAALAGAGGAFANSAVAAALVVLAFGLLLLRLRRRGVRWTPATVVTALAFAASLVSVGVRPQMLELVFVALALLLLDGWSQGGRDRLLVGLVALGWLWAQAHGSFLLLPGILGVGAIAAILAADRRWPRLAAAALGAAAVPLLNPWGAALYGFAFQSISSGTTLALVEEWRAPNFQSAGFVPFELELLLLVGGLAILRLRQADPRLVSNEHPDDRARETRDLLLTLAFLHLALQSGRHVMLFGLVAAPPLAAATEAMLAVTTPFLVPLTLPLPTRTERAGASDGPHDERTARIRRRLDLLATGVVALAVLAAGTLRVAPDAQEAALADRYPVAALPTLDRAAVASTRPRLFNEYTWGGFLIDRSPGIPVFIDGRSEVYGDVRLAQYASIVRLDPGWLATLGGLGVDHALVRVGSPIDGGLAQAGWRVLERDAVAVIYARPDGATP